MRGLISSLLSLVITMSAVAQEAGLASRLFEPTPTALALAAGGVTSPGKSDQNAVREGEKNPENLQPGRALMLSAMLPGAGEYYAGKEWRAAAFFALEIAAWTGVIYYHTKGMDKDKEFKRYADGYDSAGVHVHQHFFEQVYRDYEFALAQTTVGDSGVYTGTYDEWLEEDWNAKIHYLPDRGFTHELPTQQERSSNRSMDQQYYEMIGKYIHQFGFGWDDVFLGVPGAVTGYLGDLDDTPSYDNVGGAATHSSHYMDMRYSSNNYLDNSAIAIQIAMLNHVASALDASFTVRAMKRQARAEVGFRSAPYDGRRVVVGGLNVKW